MRAHSFHDDGKTSRIELDRRAFRRKQTLKSTMISCVSLIALAVIVYLILSHSEGWAKVRYMYFSPEHFAAALPAVAKGLLMNVKVLLASVVLVGLLSTLIALVRTTKSAVLFPLRLLANIYTDIFRGIPMIIVLYLIGFGVPALGIFGRIPMEALGTIAITMVYAAYVAEVIRAGIEAVHPSQRMAARSLGFTHARTMRTIILPQAIRKVIPALMNDFVAMQKDCGLVSVLGAVDAVRAASIYTAVQFNYASYVCAGVLFVLMSFPFILLTDRYSQKVQAREQLQGAV